MRQRTWQSNTRLADVGRPQTILLMGRQAYTLFLGKIHILDHIGHHTASGKAVVNSENLIFELQILRVGFAAGSDGAIWIANLMYQSNQFAIVIIVTHGLATSAICEVASSCLPS